MAGDQGIANAYARFFQAQEQENLMNDPFYHIANMATMAAQEWTFEKKKDKERAKKRADALGANMDEAFITAVDGYNPQTQQLAYDHLEVFTNRMNEAAKSGDKKEMNKIYSESQEFAKQLRQGQDLMKEHAKTLKEGSYSDGAGTATQNKFLAADMTDYETFMETNPEAPGYGKLHFKIKDNNGGIQVFSMDQMDKYNVKRADAFGDGYDQLIKNEVKEAINSGLYEFDKGKFEKLIKRNLADSDILYSSFHDKIFGEDRSIREMFNENYSANQDWQNIWNDQIPTHDNVISGGQGVANSGYNEDAIRGITQDRLMEMAEAEFNKRLKAYRQKVRAENNSGSTTRFGIEPSSWSYVPGMDEKVSGHDQIKAIEYINAQEGFEYNNGMTYKYDKKRGTWIESFDGKKWEPISLKQLKKNIGVPLSTQIQLP